MIKDNLPAQKGSVTNLFHPSFIEMLSKDYERESVDQMTEVRMKNASKRSSSVSQHAEASPIKSTGKLLNVGMANFINYHMYPEMAKRYDGL
jgi:hypothetical protein